MSYVKFLDPETLVTASTDNSLKLWDLYKASSNGLSNNACSLTLSGHTNEKVGVCLLDFSPHIRNKQTVANCYRCWFLFVISFSFHFPDFHFYSLVLTLYFLVLQNFVGLSVADGYIACGSETNEV